MLHYSTAAVSYLQEESKFFKFLNSFKLELLIRKIYD